MFHFLGLCFLLSSIFFCHTAEYKHEPPNEEMLAEMTENIKLAYVAYCAAPDIQTWDCTYCNLTTRKYTDIHSSSESKFDNFFFTAIEDESTLVVSFRGSVDLWKHGSEGLMNWIMNLMMFKHHLKFAPKGVKVHLGFFECYKSLRNVSIGTITEMVNAHPKIERIKFVGHSLGSAIAVLTFLDLIHTTTNERILHMINSGNLDMMTFGSPRIGNDKFHKYFEKLWTQNGYRYVRVVNQRDIITSLPPHFSGYVHPAREYYFRNDTKNYVVCDGSGEDPTCGDSVLRYKKIDHESYLGVKSTLGCF